MRVNKAASAVFALLVLFAFACSTGCGGSDTGGSSPNPPAVISVTVSPGSATVLVGSTVQFAATVQNDPKNMGVTWSISAGCEGDCGSIDATGRYTAPPARQGMLPTHSGIVATSVANLSKSAKSGIMIYPAPTGIAISPPAATVQDGESYQFAAAVVPWGFPPAVAWGVSGPGCAGAACGTVDSNGMYSAPATTPNPPTVVITATSAPSSSISGSATVAIGGNANNAKLHGNYAFLVEGYDGGGNAVMAGSFVADGSGNITSGVADLNDSSEITRIIDFTFTGTYSVTSDNRGSLTLVAPNFRQTYSFALDSFNSGIAGRGQVIELDNYELTTGILAKQDPTAFTTASVNGGYAFGFTGTSSTGWPLTANGRFTANEGSLTSGQSDVYGLGLAEDGSGTVSPAANLPFTGSYQVSPNGRGTAAFTFGTDPGFSNFSFYVVSASELFFVEIDTCGPGKCTLKAGISGTALQQSGGPFDNGSLHGVDVFNVIDAGEGTFNAGSVGVGIESFDGSGGLIGTNNENDAGVVTIGTPIQGQYSVDSSGLGRGAVTLSGDSQPRPFYLVSPGKGFIIDFNSYRAGVFEPQSGGPFGNESISGDYVLGTIPWFFNWIFSPDSGVVTANGSGYLSGVSDGLEGTGRPFVGSYNVATNGATTILVTPQTGLPSNWLFYLVSPSKAIGIEVDAGSANQAATIIEK